jgi:hypothetical protein
MTYLRRSGLVLVFNGVCFENLATRSTGVQEYHFFATWNNLTVSGSGKCNIDSATVAEETEIFRSPKWCGRVAERADEYSAGLEEEIKKGQEEAAKLTEKIEKLRSEKLDIYDLGYSGHSYQLPQCCSLRICFRSAWQQD